MHSQTQIRSPRVCGFCASHRKLLLIPNIKEPVGAIAMLTASKPAFRAADLGKFHQNLRRFASHHFSCEHDFGQCRASIGDDWHNGMLTLPLRLRAAWGLESFVVVRYYRLPRNRRISRRASLASALLCRNHDILGIRKATISTSTQSVSKQIARSTTQNGVAGLQPDSSSCGQQRSFSSRLLDLSIVPRRVSQMSLSGAM